MFNGVLGLSGKAAFTSGEPGLLSFPAALYQWISAGKMPTKTGYEQPKGNKASPEVNRPRVHIKT